MHSRNVVTWGYTSTTVSDKPLAVSVAKCIHFINRLESRGNYSAPSNNMKLVYWLSMGALSHLVQRGGDWAGLQAPSRCTKCNSAPIDGQCTNHCIAV